MTTVHSHAKFNPVPGVSACIVCRNEADKLPPCLASLDWVDEVIVMDLDSSDASADVSRAHGAQVVAHAPVPIVELVRNDVSAHAAHDWILVIDPDERITPRLAQILREVSTNEQVDAVIIPRMNCDLGFPPTHPLQRYEPQLRMYRRSRVSWPTVPNALPVVPEERLFRIPTHDDLVMVHERSRNIPEVLDRSLRYAPLQAQSMIDAGEVFTARAMLHALGSTAYKQFVTARAWQDGVPGLLRAGLLVGFKFYVWAAFWQQSSGERTVADDRFMRQLGIVSESFRYFVSAVTIVMRSALRLRTRLGTLSKSKPQPGQRSAQNQ